MRYVAAASLLAALASTPALATDDASLTVPHPVSNTQFLSPVSTTGFWQVAGSGQFHVSENVTFTVDYLHYQPGAQIQTSKEPDAINLRGAYDFSSHWQGFVQVAGGTFIMADPNTAMALREQSAETMNFGGGVRYSFGNGMYLEGVVQLAEPADDVEEFGLNPLMSVGYQF
ncbi:hypothetical protein K0504_14800 [Neiella marina]|uniref:Outer membrane protein beta-barrel domain-containing protein n=1 Tax=Neiella holothuriorum TaxID=2870530 RepID=A0ABS7EIY7_9GAMM|nr:hypothetical protein [Neiella holothuriorum]MBW8192304.1 hypothetical protein [Neiella holothuriorum]